jgi:hypothetical protein
MIHIKPWGVNHRSAEIVRGSYQVKADQDERASCISLSALLAGVYTTAFLVMATLKEYATVVVSKQDFRQGYKKYFPCYGYSAIVFNNVTELKT